MGTILGFGGLHIRRTDGVSSKIFEFTMTNHKKMSAAVHNSVINFKKGKVEKNEQIHSNESLSYELRKLADLNKDGIISNEEFKQLKSKLIN